MHSQLCMFIVYLAEYVNWFMLISKTGLAIAMPRAFVEG